MNPVTATSFITLGISHFCLKAGKIKIAITLSSLIFAIAFIRFLGFWFTGLDIHIDEVFFTSSLQGNKMAPNTTFDFILCALAHILLISKKEKHTLTAQGLCLFAFTIALLAFIGYIYNALSLYQLKTFIPMALHAAVCFLLLSSLLLFYKPQNGFIAIITSRYDGGRLARTFLTIAIITPIIFGWLRILAINHAITDPEFGTALLIIAIMLVFGAVIFFQANLLNRADMERRYTEQQLFNAKEVALAAKEVAEDAKKSQEQFLANMSHELRTPLNSILILSKLLGNNAHKNLSEKQQEQAKIINSAGNDLLNLINDILDISKIESGEVIIEKEKVRIQDIRTDLENLFTPIASQKNIEFITDTAQNLSQFFNTDSMRLEQVLKNLLSNAFKFTNQGGTVKFSIYTAYENNIPNIIFSVTDNGIGIPADKQKHVFEAFKQVDGSTSRKYGGTGLGLSISKRLTDLLGGTISLSSEPGKGSIFTITLPLENDDIIAANELPLIIAGTIPQQTSPGLQAALKDKTLMIIDDDEKCLSALSAIFHTYDLNIITAGSGKEAIEKLSENIAVDLILLDIFMPGMDGNETIKVIKQYSQFKSLPIIVVSAIEPDKRNEQLYKENIVAYVSKPIDIELLLNQIYNTLKAN